MGWFGFVKKTRALPVDHQSFYYVTASKIASAIDGLMHIDEKALAQPMARVVLRDDGSVRLAMGEPAKGSPLLMNGDAACVFLREDNDAYAEWVKSLAYEGMLRTAGTDQFSGLLASALIQKLKTD